MQKYLYLDIETIPAQRQDVIVELRAEKQAALDAALSSIKPPGNYKKQETIDEWLATEAPKQAQALRDAFEVDVDAAYRKTGLDGAYGQVCVIGFAVGGAQPVALSVDDFTNPYSESELLAGFGDALESVIHPSMYRVITVVGHNICSFDLRFLVQRHIVNGIQPHPIIRAASQAKPWDTGVFDTMVQWAGAGKSISLDRLCKALSIPTPKGELTGAKVWDYVSAGRMDEVAEYCVKDVEATRAAHLKMTFQGLKMDLLEDVPV